MKVIVSGSRDFHDYDFVKRWIDAILFLDDDLVPGDIEIVHGDARGVDQLADRYGKENGMKVTPFGAEWSKYGASAGPIRNGVMAQYCSKRDFLIAFLSKRSKGTKDMVEQADFYGIPYKIIHI